MKQKRLTTDRAKGNKAWNEAVVSSRRRLSSSRVFSDLTMLFNNQTRWAFFTLLTCETLTCISENCWVLIKHGVSWRVFGLCFFFHRSARGIFCWIICSERLGIGFVSSAERPRRRWSDASVCYRSGFVEAVHLQVLLSICTTTLRKEWLKPVVKLPISLNII